ncbi:MAG: peptidylprolyl isomerase [Myxococcales bacterium]|nr:peptidylprolyl isomerase [Myxococcales bacterium]
MRRMSTRIAIAIALVTLTAGCSKSSPPEPTPATKDPSGTESAPTNAATSTAGEGRPKETAPTPAKHASSGSGDPHDGSFSLAEATKDLKGKGPILAKIDTSKGALQCKLYDDKTPITVANFIGLATGKRAFQDPATGAWVKRPAYDGTTFHRIIKGFMIQGGDPKGDGSGGPGYTIKDELWEGAKHDRAGLLCMANRGPDTNGAQFFITDGNAPHLDREDPRTGQRNAYTIFGECAPLEILHDIAGVSTDPGDRPVTPVKIKSVTISREPVKK